MAELFKGSETPVEIVVPRTVITGFTPADQKAYRSRLLDAGASFIQAQVLAHWMRVGTDMQTLELCDDLDILEEDGTVVTVLFQEVDI